MDVTCADKQMTPIHKATHYHNGDSWHIDILDGIPTHAMRRSMTETSLYADRKPVPYNTAVSVFFLLEQKINPDTAHPR
jgi:hypothetical protein